MSYKSYLVAFNFYFINNKVYYINNKIYFTNSKVYSINNKVCFINKVLPYKLLDRHKNHDLEATNFVMKSIHRERHFSCGNDHGNHKIERLLCPRLGECS